MKTSLWYARDFRVDAHSLQQQYIFTSQDEVRQKCWTDFMSAVMAEVLTILDVHNHYGNLGIACRAGFHGATER